ncbi:hypothetical protein AgCh_034031 [Apium graveolens]
MAQYIVRAIIPEKGTNFIAFLDANQAPDSFKGFVKFLSESYIAGALTASPVLYLDVFHEFWTSAITRTVVLEHVTSMVVTCTIGGQEIEFSAADVNTSLGLPTENYGEMPTADELSEFIDFINYSGSINLASLNRTNLRKEWSFVFDSVVRAFTCRKTGFDNISSVVQKLVFSIAHNRHLNVGGLILEELATRLTMPLKNRDVSNPTTLVSQKTEVSKKKRKEPTLVVVNESETLQTEPESPLVKKPKKSKLLELTTLDTSVSSQKGTVEQMGSKQLLDTSSQQGVSIEKSIHPNASCTESAQPAPRVYGRRNKDGTHSEGTSLEAPSSIQEELPTLTTEQTSLISQISSSYIALESDSQVHQHSSDMVHETVLTTQNQHLDSERLLAGVDLDDTIINMGVSSVLTEDPMVTLAPSCAQSSSQMNRFEGSTLEGELSESSPIQLEVPLEGTTPLKTLAEISFSVEARSTIANDPVMGEASLSHLCDSALLVNLSQQLLTSDMGNQDYQAILLCFNEEVEQQKEKIVDEAEEDVNVDAWLSGDHVAEMDEVLARFRREYITILGSNAKTLTPPEVYDAIMDVHKAQLKAFHLFGKALEVQLTGHEDKVRRLIKEQMDDIVPSQKDIKNQFQSFTEQMSRMDLASIEKEISKMRSSFKALFDQVQAHMTNSNDTGVKLNQMHTARYEPSFLLMESVRKAVDEHLRSFSAKTSTSQIQELQDQVSSLQASNSDLSSQVRALTTLVESQHHDIQALVESHKHLQMQNIVALGAIMGKLNIPLPALSKAVRPEIPTPLLMPVTKTKGEIDARLVQSTLAQSTLKSQEQGLEQERLLMAAQVKDQFLEKRIVINLNDSGVDRCMQVNFNYLISRRASEIDILINKVRIINNEEKMLLAELKKAQEAAFPEAYLHPSKWVHYICSTTKQLKHFQVPKNCIMANRRLIMLLESGLKSKKLKTNEDEAMIKILRRYIDNSEANLPKTKINTDDFGDDEQKKDGQNPSGSNSSQSSKAIGGKSDSEKEKEKKSGSETQRKDGRRQRQKNDTSQSLKTLNIQIPTAKPSHSISSKTAQPQTSKPKYFYKLTTNSLLKTQITYNHTSLKRLKTIPSFKPPHKTHFKTVGIGPKEAKVKRRIRRQRRQLTAEFLNDHGFGEKTIWNRYNQDDFKPLNVVDSDEDYFQQLAERIVRVWVFNIREVRIYYSDGSFEKLGDRLKDSLSIVELKRVISLMNGKDSATKACRTVLAVFMVNRELLAERRRKYEHDIDEYIRRSEDLKMSEVLDSDASSSDCTHPRSPSIALGLIAARALVMAQTIIDVPTGSLSRIRVPYESDYSWMVARFCYGVSWLTFLVAFLLLLRGAVLKDMNGEHAKYLYYDNYSFYVIKPEVFAAVTILSLTIVVLGILSYIMVQSAKNIGDSRSHLLLLLLLDNPALSQDNLNLLNKGHKIQY